jgi:hypothetical protein
MNSDNHNAVYYERLGIDHFLKHYKAEQIGICQVTDHPLYGINSYPATIFTSADAAVITKLLDKLIIKPERELHEIVLTKH